MKIEDIEYLPETSDTFQEDQLIELFRSEVRARLEQYIIDQRDNEMPVSVMDFAVSLVYQLGIKTGRRIAGAHPGDIGFPGKPDDHDYDYEEPPIEEHDLGPEVDDEGGASEFPRLGGSYEE
jgi:hypothetical protein